MLSNASAAHFTHQLSISFLASLRSYLCSQSNVQPKHAKICQLALSTKYKSALWEYYQF